MRDYTSHLLFKAPGTADAVRSGTKDVTRRLVKHGVPCRWRPGAWARCYERDPRAGGKPFGRVRINVASRELLTRVLDRGALEVRREGFPHMDPGDFCTLFREMHGLRDDEDAWVWRIVFADFTEDGTP